MPVVARMDLPKPQDWQEFEAMTLAALRLKWNSPNLQLNGRPGQKQDGVDIFGPDDLGRPTGIQCKKTTSGVTMEIIEDELAKAESFGTPLTTNYIATTAASDSRLQQEVRTFSVQRVQAGKSAVGLINWGDVIDGLMLNPIVFQNFYPNISLSGAPPVATPERLMWAVELGFYGPYLWSYVELVMGEAGWIAGEDHDQLRVTVELVDVQAQRILPTQTAAVVHQTAEALIAALFPLAGAPNFGSAKPLAQRIAFRIKQALTLLPAIDAQALRVGMRLGTANLADDGMTPGLFSELRTEAHALLGAASRRQINRGADEVLQRHRMNWPIGLYSLILRECTRRAAH